ncbi:MAG: hypothetical protein V4717_10070 [Bacteroidota bacterium]
MMLLNIKRPGFSTRIVIGSIYFSFIVIAIIIPANTCCQSISDSILIKFNSYGRKNLQEKLFVHTDKNYYLAGEMLWMKIYQTDAFFNRPLSLSTVAYTELLDNKNNPVLQIKSELQKAHGTAAIFIPVTFASGNYKLRTYTAWMKNYSADFYFEKSITIVNSQQPVDVSPANISKNVNISFYPEGGHLVYNLASKIAVAVTDNEAKGLLYKGVITDENGSTITSFSPYKFGLAKFEFKPGTGHRYTATITLADGTVVTKSLPEINDDGFVMQLVTGDANSLAITVTATQNALKNTRSVFLLAHTRHSVKKVMSATFTNGIAVFKVAVESLGEGVSHFTIFDENKHPILERLYFRPPLNKFDIMIEPGQQVYGSRSKIDLNIRATIDKEAASQADLSMAVYKLDSLQPFDQQTITDYLWLSSDLTGKVESPWWYFDQKDSSVIAADNLMLTHGWRRFSWDKMLYDQPSVIKLPAELNGHLVTGKIVDNKNNQPVIGIKGYLTVPGLKPIFKIASSDSNGNIQFLMRDFYATPGIIVQTATDGDDSLNHVEIASPFSYQYSNNFLPSFKLASPTSSLLLEKSIAMQVQNVYGATNAHLYTNLTSDSLPFYNYSNDSYLLDKYTRFTTVEEIFREYVPYVSVRRRNGRFHLPVFDDSKHNGSFDVDPLVLIDGLPVFNFNAIMAYDPLKIRKVDIVTRRFAMGKTYFDGIINFSTYKGDLEAFEIDPKATVLDYEALQLQREFNAPVYNNEEQFASHKPDFRSLLQWSPNIKTGSNGQAQINFYSSDITGKFVAIAQGITASGKTGNGFVYFEVK